VYELFFSVPLDYSKPHDKKLRVFARSVEPAEKSTSAPSTSVGQTDSVPNSRRPWLVYLPGGPGFGARQPQDYPFTDFILEKGYQVCIQVKSSSQGKLSPPAYATLLRPSQMYKRLLFSRSKWKNSYVNLFD
jgi:hypothetical protein